MYVQIKIANPGVYIFNVEQIAKENRTLLGSVTLDGIGAAP